MVTVEGIFRNGKVELAKAPAGTPDETPVLVLFLPERGSAPAGGEQVDREAAAARLLAGMQAGLDFGGPFNRETLYAERLEQLQR